MADDAFGESRMEQLWECLGIPRALIKEPAMIERLTLCAMEVFCDETSMTHPGPPADAQLRELFGARSFEEGSFRRALQELLAEAPPTWRSEIEEFQWKLAEVLANWVVVQGIGRHILPSTNVVNDTLVFDANEHSYQLPSSPRPRVVVDYGPGLCERFILDEHIRALAEDRPFFYLPVTRGPFVNCYAVCCLMLTYGSDVVNRYLAAGCFLVQDDGMLAATSRLLSSSICGQTDVIFCSGLHLADKRELEAGIVNAFALLRPGGVLLIRAQKTRNPPESSTVDDMLAIAYRAGFAVPQHVFHSISGDPRLGKRTPTLSALLIKS